MLEEENRQKEDAEKREAELYDLQLVRNQKKKIKVVDDEVSKLKKELIGKQNKLKNGNYSEIDFVTSATVVTGDPDSPDVEYEVSFKKLYGFLSQEDDSQRIADLKKKQLEGRLTEKDRALKKQIHDEQKFKYSRMLVYIPAESEEESTELTKRFHVSKKTSLFLLM